MIKTILTGILTATVFFAAKAQIVNIPDPALKNYLINHSYNTNPTGIGTQVFLDSNGDDEIQYSEAASYTSNVFDHGFNISSLNISDLTGMEAFTSIQSLNASFNQIASFDAVNGCSSLKALNVNYNPITSFDLVNASLETIDLTNCAPLSSVVLGGCPALKRLTCQQIPNLTSLDVVGCTSLEELRVNFNPLLSSLSMANHWVLTLFQCYDNNLTSIDVSGCPILEYLFCTGNQLQSLNLANGFPQSFAHILATGYPDLTCVQVDNVAVSEFLWADYPYEFDEWAIFNTDCTPPGPCIVTIPDPNFKAQLIGNTAINTNGNNEIECEEAEAYSGGINVDNADISDMTGIKAFVNLTALSLNNNNFWNLDSLDVSDLTALTTISCTGNNQFTHLNASGCTSLIGFNVNTNIGAGLSINVSNCAALSSLNLASHQLNELKVSGCSSLTDLVCNNNYLTSLDLSGCNALTSLICNSNQITSLDLNYSPLLTYIDCSENELTSLFTFANTALSVLDCSNNQLSFLVISTNSALTNLNCSYNNLNYLDTNNNTALVILNCSYNSLNTLQVNNNPALLNINCSFNNLSALNVSADSSLTYLNCSNNDLSTVDVSANEHLQDLSCASNMLPTIDVSNNLDLRSLDCSSNQLSDIDLSNNHWVYQLACSYNPLSELNLQNDTSLIILYCKQNQLTSLDVSNTRVLLLECDDNELETLNLANGYNNMAIAISAENNPELTCVQVDNAEFSTENWIVEPFLFDSGVTFSVDCSLLTGIDDQIKQELLTVYPNPTKDVAYFSTYTNVRVTNAVGQVIDVWKNVNTIDLSAEPAGIYIITFTNNEGEIVQRSKIVKE